MDEAIRKLQEQSYKTRQAHNEQRLMKERLQGREEVFWATYNGYSASIGLYRATKIDGSKIYVRGLLPGGVGIGDMVMVCQPSSGSHAFLVT